MTTEEKVKLETIESKIDEITSKSGALDKIFGKVASRKLMVWMTATALMSISALESEHWVWISIVYLGGQSAIDIFERIKGYNKK
jgi:hypothetical protein|tara:strand:- start:374 stop:628 length:255 start_codon:yes stop_codon:yes gene_type:complete